MIKLNTEPLLKLNSISNYTLLQKKCTLISSNPPSDPGSLTSTPGHVKVVKWSWEKYAKDPVKHFKTVREPFHVGVSDLGT